MQANIKKELTDYGYIHNVGYFLVLDGIRQEFKNLTDIKIVIDSIYQ